MIMQLAYTPYTIRAYPSVLHGLS